MIAKGAVPKEPARDVTKDKYTLIRCSEYLSQGAFTKLFSPVGALECLDLQQRAQSLSSGAAVLSLGKCVDPQEK